MAPSGARDKALVSAFASLGLFDPPATAPSTLPVTPPPPQPRLTTVQRFSILCSASLGAPTCTTLLSRTTELILHHSRSHEKDANATRQLMDAGSADLLVSILSRPSELNAGLRATAAHALANLAGSSLTDAKNQIEKLGAIPILLSNLLEAFQMERRDLMMQSLRCLGNLCFGTESAPLRRKLAVLHWTSPQQETTLSLLTSILTNYTHTDAVLLRWSCHLLAHLSYGHAPNDRQRALVSTIELVVLAVKESVKWPVAVWTTATESLSNLIFRFEQGRKRAVDCGAIGVFASVLNLALRENEARAVELALIGLFELSMVVELGGEVMLVVKKTREELGGNVGVMKWAGKVLAGPGCGTSTEHGF